MKDQRIEKWTRWLEGPIKSDVLTMHLQRDAWREVAKILKNHGELPESYWWEFMHDTYAASQAVAVRRQADTHKGVASLGKLVKEVRDDPSRITRDFWIGLWDTDAWARRDAERSWNEHFAGCVGHHLDPAIPNADFDALTTASARVKTYVDQHIAHADASAAPVAVTLTLGDVHDVIDVIGRLFKKYYNLLTASSYSTLVPVIQHDWTAIFRQPWLSPYPDD